MRKLRADPIDLIQVHNLIDADAHLDTLRNWKREGRVRYLGITHYTASSIDQVASVMTARNPDFIQINYSIGERDAERNLLPLARERGVAVIANRPFAGGRLLGRLARKPLPSCAIPATSKEAHLRDNMGGRHGPPPGCRAPCQNSR